MHNLLLQLKHMFKMLKHPIDGMEELRENNAGGFLSSCIIIILVIACRVFSLRFTNFIFNKNGFEKTPFAILLLQILAAFILWVIANYLVSAIAKGQGRFIDVFTGTAYALAPYVVLSIPVSVLSNIFTLQEETIYYFTYYFMFVWCGFLLFLQVMLVHGYEIPETFVNMFGTVFTIFIMLVLGAALVGIFVHNLSLGQQIWWEVTNLG